MYGSANHDERAVRASRRVRDRPLPPGVRRCRPPQLHHRDPRVPRWRTWRGCSSTCSWSGWPTGSTRSTIAGPVVRSYNALVRVIDELPARRESLPGVAARQFFANLSGPPRSRKAGHAGARPRAGTASAWPTTSGSGRTTVLPLGGDAGPDRRGDRTGHSCISCFANNLLRSPVEFAQAALTLQRASDGRFEAGLGAGWSREEAEGIRPGVPAGG